MVIVAGLKLLAMAGGATTVSVALAVLPAPPLLELTATLLFFVPTVVPVTLTEMVHELLAATVPPVRLTVLDPAVAVTVPPQAPTTLGVAATCTPVGSVSVKLTPVNVTVLAAGLLVVKLSVEVPFSAMLVGLKTLLMTGGATTVSVA